VVGSGWVVVGWWVGGGWVMAYSILVSAPVTLWVNLGFELDLTGLGLGLGELGTRGTRVWN
jgi:hypothetical protein